MTFVQAEHSAQPSHSAGEDLSNSDDEADLVSLEEAYRSILAGTGLSAAALASWLEPWMQYVTSEVGEMAKGGIASTIPGSKAADLLVQSRLGRAVAFIAGRASALVKD